MRFLAVFALSVFLHLSWVPQSAATTQADLPGDRADIVAQELMSPF
jgi:hypothetical protein